MRFFSLILLIALAASAEANVVRKAADFSWPGAGNKSRSLRSLKGQPVVLIIADSPRHGAFRKQVKWLEKTYSQLAAKGAVFIVAFREGEGPVKSDIPFVVANSGGAVADAYGADSFALVIVGKDGNVDYQTDRVRTGERIRDIVINNYSIQAAGRK